MPTVSNTLLVYLLLFIFAMLLTFPKEKISKFLPSIEKKGKTSFDKLIYIFCGVWTLLVIRMK
jgi:hypothetical protein